jgi:hypothetical protein
MTGAYQLITHFGAIASFHDRASEVDARIIFRAIGRLPQAFSKKPQDDSNGKCAWRRLYTTETKLLAEFDVS